MNDLDSIRERVKLQMEVEHLRENLRNLEQRFNERERDLPSEVTRQQERIKEAEEDIDKLDEMTKKNEMQLQMVTEKAQEGLRSLESVNKDLQQARLDLATIKGKIEGAASGARVEVNMEKNTNTSIDKVEQSGAGSALVNQGEQNVNEQ